MIIVVAIDALEFNLVEKWNLATLKQKSYGKTDISDFSQPRTIVLWSSFLTGKNKEHEILALGDKGMWNYSLSREETFLRYFSKAKVIDLPGYNYDLDEHKASRELLKRFFTTEDKDMKAKIKKEYNERAFAHHKKVKKEFLEAVNQDYDIVIGYFAVGDVIGHLNFGNQIMMRMIYKEFDDIAKEAALKSDFLLIMSDHGMQAVGEFGDHSNYGFWSTSKNLNLIRPKITELGKVLVRER